MQILWILGYQALQQRRYNVVFGNAGDDMWIQILRFGIVADMERLAPVPELYRCFPQRTIGDGQDGNNRKDEYQICASMNRRCPWINIVLNETVLMLW